MSTILQKVAESYYVIILCGVLFYFDHCQQLMGHNEDGDRIDVNTTFMVHARIVEPGRANEDASAASEEFTALCYAAELCGNAFGFNLNTGVAFTVNAVFPKKINSSGVRECFCDLMF